MKFKTIEKIKFYVIALMFLLVTASCSDDLLNDMEQEANGEYKISLTIPGCGATRGSSAFDAPDLWNLELYLLVFEDTGNPNTNALKQIVKASPPYTVDGDIAYFKADFSTTDRNVIFHLIAVEDPNVLSNVTEFLPEALTMQLFLTKSGQDGYWQRVVANCPIKEDNKDEVNRVLTRVPMVRNYAKVTMETMPGVNNFEILGFNLINIPDRGTIAPYMIELETGFPEFVVDRNIAENEKFKPKSYQEIIAQGYTGVRAPGAVKTNSDPDMLEYTDASPKYMYEKPFIESNHTYVIFKARYTDTTIAGNQSGEYYYKVDLGYTDPATGLFRYYNLLRNIHYQIRITGVESKGYNSASEAAAGPAFNNFSADVSTRNMLSLSDGNEMMYVNFTSYVMVDQDDEPTLMFRYYENMATSSDGRGVQNNDAVIFDTPGIGLEKGEIIADWGYYENDAQKTGWISGQAKTVVYNGSTWKAITIKPNKPTAQLKEQQFIIYKPFGLSRTITLISKTSWNIIEPVTYAGQWDMGDRRPDIEKYPQIRGAVGSQGDANLTIYFELPDGLPEAMFPLEFTYEADRQNIQNAYIGNAVVISGPSLFEDIDDIRIKYVKTVQWEDYDVENYPGASHLIRARFKTITDIANYGETQTLTKVKIYNKYFNEAETDFTRIQGVHPDPFYQP